MEAGGAAASEQPQHVQTYPLPPAFFRLYRDDADGSAERPLPPLPPAPVEGEFQMFGELHTTEDGIPPLQVRQLFEVGKGGYIDFRKELGRLNREALFGLLELVDALVDRPSAYARLAENIGLTLRNANYLLNLLRAHQARATLEHTLEVELRDRLAAVSELREARAKSSALLTQMAEELAQACTAASGLHPP
ncbi:hypothetical protein WJX81_003367 [Elliptochloris bilobata]|uniref:Mediator of RNA polymerase II transcription subunit 7 n=1 Tax=Elliptochloris bilobata TaxID=381761 RepID=A0AAW1QJ12_9CHLO